MLGLYDVLSLKQDVVKCPYCPNPLTDDGFFNHYMDGVWVCADCYFKNFGDFIEKNPIGTPRRHR